MHSKKSVWPGMEPWGRPALTEKTKNKQKKNCEKWCPFLEILLWRLENLLVFFGGVSGEQLNLFFVKVDTSCIATWQIYGNKLRVNINNVFLSNLSYIHISRVICIYLKLYGYSGELYACNSFNVKFLVIRNSFLVNFNKPISKLIFPIKSSENHRVSDDFKGGGGGGGGGGEG